MRGGLGRRHIGADTARTSAPPQPSALSVRFGVDDLTGAAIVGSRLHNILTAWAAKQTVLAGHKAFLRQQGDMAIILVEQYFDFARDLADDFLVMDRGEVVMAGTRETMDEAAVRARIAV